MEFVSTTTQTRLQSEGNRFFCQSEEKATKHGEQKKEPDGEEELKCTVEPKR